VHFAAIPAILIRPDNETFRINTLSTYNVIDAAVKLGIRKVIFASSETTYGICFADGEVMPEYVPIDEEHPTVPHDSYAMSKVVNEATARSFQARSGIDLYGLRINNVIDPDGLGDAAADALACIGPQGIDGCGMEAPLEAMLLALQPLNAWCFAAIAGVGLTLFQQMIARPGLATGLYMNTRRIGAIVSGPVIALGSLTVLGQRGIFLAAAALTVISLGIILVAGRTGARTESPATVASST
jgi:hypothetical protein